MPSRLLSKVWEGSHAEPRYRQTHSCFLFSNAALCSTSASYEEMLDYALDIFIYLFLLTLMVLLDL